MTPKIFISHSHQDRDFVDWLVRELRQNGIDVWWDADELAIGDYIKNKIKEGILASSAFIIVLSEHSTKSAWVQFELNSALLYNATKNNIKIIPIKIDESNVPSDLNNYLYIDASRNRLVALEHLIRALYVPDKPTYKFDDWSNFSAKSFQDFVYDLLKFEGHNINRMPQMRDSGFDFEIEDINSFQQKERILVECKFYKSSVSIATLSQLYGVLQESKASKALLITNSELTSASKAYLSKTSNQIHVWEGHDLIEKLNKFPELLLKYFPRSVL
ncbi:MAG TPA: TIR domain-containing protein [Mucilaginibacter sp.]|nr:TIR domain-containing protein [Mucilaginibacter sp.]